MTTNKPKVSVVVPIHDMKNGEFFLWRLVNSLTAQTFKDWELIITKEGKMAENTNAGIKRARGEFIKIMYLDDYFNYNGTLLEIVNEFDNGAEWVICSTNDNYEPYWTDDIETGNNKLGSPSALTIKNEAPLLFDERMSWLLDCDYYKRMFEKHGEPRILNREPYIGMGKGEHQMTHILTDQEKLAEHELITQKYA